MFVGDEVMLDISFTSARARLGNLARSDLLMSASDDAYGGGITGVLRVGPAGCSRLARVQLCDLQERPDVAGLALRWEVTGPGGALFPVLDADIELVRAGPQATWLTLAGTYRPPVGSVGNALDRAILHRLARATIRGFVSRMAVGITGQPGPAQPRAAGAGVDLCPRSRSCSRTDAARTLDGRSARLWLPPRLVAPLRAAC